MYPTRRRFLQTIASTASLGLADVPSLRGLAAFAAEGPLEKVRFGPDIEPIVRLIEETPRDRCLPALVAELRRGLSYRRFLSAIFLAAVRRQNSHHQMYKVHSVNQVSLDLRPEERVLPLFWAVDAFKAVQERTGPPVPPLPELTGALPSPDKAVAEFQDAVKQADKDRVERALVALGRAQGARPAIEHLWTLSCNNGNFGGHRAISLANASRALETVGWQHAEPVLRFVVRESDGKPDGFFAANTARVDKHLDRLPTGWAGGTGDRAATRELFAALREGKGDAAACDLAGQQLLAGVGAQAIWDAVHLATAEMLVRLDNGWGIASRPLHLNTSTNALRYAFQTCTSARTRLLSLLQAVAWVAEGSRVHVARGFRDIQLTNLAHVQVPADAAESVAEVFALVPARTFYWDDKAKKGVQTYGKREAADEACRKVFVLAQKPEAAQLYTQEARSWLVRKVTGDSHDYKFVAAILENADWVSPEWRPHILAASVHWCHGKQSPDNPIVQQAREALEKKG